MDSKEYLPTIALAVAAGSFALTHFRTKAMSDVIARLAVVEKQIGLFWGVAEKQIGNLLHSPHRPELDELIEKNADPYYKLTEEEVIRFQQILQQLIDGSDTPADERTNAVLMQAIVAGKYCATPFDEFAHVLAERPNGLELFCMEIAA